MYVFKHSLQPIQQTIRTAVYVPDMPALTSPASYPDIAASEPYILTPNHPIPVLRPHPTSYNDTPSNNFSPESLSLIHI